MMGSLLAFVIVVQPAFKDADALGEQQRDDEVDQGDDGVGLEVQVRLGGVAAAELHEVGHGHDGDQRGILEHGDAFVAHRGNDGAQGLRKDDVHHGLDLVVMVVISLLAYRKRSYSARL